MSKSKLRENRKVKDSNGEELNLKQEEKELKDKARKFIKKVIIPKFREARAKNHTSKIKIEIYFPNPRKPSKCAVNCIANGKTTYEECECEEEVVFKATQIAQKEFNIEATQEVKVIQRYLVINCIFSQN